MNAITREDRKRLREFRYKLQELWYPPLEEEIKEWRSKAGVNSLSGTKEFAYLSSEKRLRFFSEADAFIHLVEQLSRSWRREKFPVIKDEQKNSYMILGLDESASLSDIRKRYRRLVLESHPDRGGDPDRFIRIMNAYHRICVFFNAKGNAVS